MRTGGPGAVFAGLLLVFLDFHIKDSASPGPGVDLIPDLLGWLLCCSGLNRLRRLHAGFGAALAFSVALALLSSVTTLFSLVESDVDLGGLLRAEEVAGELVCALVALALAAVHPVVSERTIARGIGIVLGVSVLASLVTLPFTGGREIEAEGPGVVVVIVLALTALVATIWLLVLLLRLHRAGWPPALAPAVQPS